MKNALFILVLLMGCSPRYIPVDYNGHPLVKVAKYGALACEGGGALVAIDTVTALGTLIHRLNSKRPTVETGKAYFIGYTNDQFSIAARGEAAIPALMHYIRTDADPLGKAGAIYALHLIGINSRVAGRQYEEFSNVKARDALRELLQVEGLQDQVMELLKRDPWQSDVPYLIGVLSKSKTDNWPIINCLPRYEIPGLPIHETVPPALANISLETSPISYTVQLDDLSRENTLIANASETDIRQELEKPTLDALVSLQKREPEKVSLDTSLMRSLRNGTGLNYFAPNVHYSKVMNEMPVTIPMSQYLSGLTRVEYCGRNGSRIQYYIENNRLYICSTITAKQRLLTWWNSLPLEQKNSFTQNAGPR